MFNLYSIIMFSLEFIWELLGLKHCYSKDKALWVVLVLSVIFFINWRVLSLISDSYIVVIIIVMCLFETPQCTTTNAMQLTLDSSSRPYSSIKEI